MYKKLLKTNANDLTIEHIFLSKGNNLTVCFPNTEDNYGPERKAYLEWVAEGNEAEEWVAE